MSAAAVAVGLACFFSFVALQASGGRTLKLQRVSVPQYKLKGEMALLQCLYELGEDSLYSVKWYKDDEEFYRYVPKSKPPQHSYKIDGIRVEQHLSDDKQVVLRNLNFKSSGVYRCEVSAEAPSFASAQQEGRMDVVYLPKEGPHITGEEKLYQVGDEISLNCTSGKSYPASQLQWYINEQPVQSDDYHLEEYPLLRHSHGMVSSSLGLRFTVAGQHFLHGSMRLRCVASVSHVLWQGDRESVVQRITPPPETIMEALFLVRGSAARVTTPAVAFLLTTCVAMATIST